MVVAVSVHPGATTFRAALSLAPLRWLGSRSYGLYLWHWPVFMVTRQQDYPNMDGRARFALRLGLTFALTELSFRLVERPVRDGSAMQWITDWRADRARRARARGWAAVGATAAVLSVAFVGARVATADPVDVTTGGSEEVFQPATAALSPLAPVAAAGAVPSTVAAASGPGGSATGTLPPHLPRRVVVVGDSQASALVKNAPSGLGRTLALANGAVEGCGLFDHGTIRTTADFRRSFGNCQGWPDKWAASARRSKADIALVVIGAWDVFDVAQDPGVLAFGSPAHDAYLLAQLQRGVSGLVAAGSQGRAARGALLRPGRRWRAARPPRARRPPAHRPPQPPAAPDRQQRPGPRHVRPRARGVVQGPAIATDLGYRWDGVHDYRPGAKLVFETIAPALVALPQPAR